MVKMQTLVGQWLHERYSGFYYAKSQNLARKLSEAYDAALTEFDVLVMPTLPAKAVKLPDEVIEAAESVSISHQMGVNTAPFNVTGHPAMNVPCSMSEGLPIGMMVVGRRGQDGLVLRVAHAFERSIYRPEPPRSEMRAIPK
jgi:amidase